MQLVLALGGILAGLVVMVRWSLRVGPERTAASIRWLSVIAALLFLLVLTARGGAALALPLLILLVLLLVHWRRVWHPSPGAAGNDRRSSTVETRFLRMSLNHRSGQMWGAVLEGCFTGRELASLKPEELYQLYRECEVDPQSAAVLAAYLERQHDAEWKKWQDRPDESPPGGNTPMTQTDAYEILGLQPGASREEIKLAHRRLMQRVHPDHGGSTYLATRVNQAKDLLLRN